MNVMSIIAMLVQMLASIPVVGKVLAVVIPALGGLSAAVTAFSALWHAVVMLLTALSGLPELGGLAKLAAALKADEAKVDDFSTGTILPFLNQLSVIPLPSAPVAPAPVAPPAA